MNEHSMIIACFCLFNLKEGPLRTSQKPWFFILGLLFALGGLAQTSTSQQFTGGKNISRSTNVGGVFATGDINRDGKLDIVSYDQSKGSVVVLLGNDKDTFTEKVPTRSEEHTSELQSR